MGFISSHFVVWGFDRVKTIFFDKPDTKVDPVLLPTSNTVMDRKVVVIHGYIIVGSENHF